MPRDRRCSPELSTGPVDNSARFPQPFVDPPVENFRSGPGGEPSLNRYDRGVVHMPAANLVAGIVDAETPDQNVENQS